MEGAETAWENFMEELDTELTKKVNSSFFSVFRTPPSDIRACILMESEQ